MINFVLFSQVLGSLYGSTATVPDDIFVNPEKAALSARNASKAWASAGTRESGKQVADPSLPVITNYDPKLYEQGIPADPNDPKDLELLISSVLKHNYSKVPALRARLETVYSPDTLATDVGVALILDDRGPEALGWLAPFAEFSATDDSWMLWYSLALAQSGREMKGQRAFLANLRRTVRPESEMWTMLPKDSEPGSLAVQTIYAICLGSSKMYQSSRDTILMALKYRADDPWACMEMGVRAHDAQDYAEAKRWLAKGKGYSKGTQEMVDQIMNAIRRRGF